jgi:hypothetical protein
MLQKLDTVNSNTG